jgi:hypothetical protein
MSAETRAAMQDAIAAHMADENDGAVMTGYVLQTEGQHIQGEFVGYTSYMGAVPEHQSHATSLGLALMAQRSVEYMPPARIEEG